MQVFHHGEDAQTSAYSSVCVIFVCLGIPKVDKQTVTKQLSDMPIVASNHLRTGGLVGTYHVSVHFWVELGCQFGRFDDVDEHHRELTTFGFWCVMVGWWRC